MTRVAVVGVGAMGSRIARRLLAAGHEVTLWNRSPAKLGPLLAYGFHAASTPADASATVDVLITMVSDPGALAEVIEGPTGVVAGAHPRLTMIEMSTVGPAAVSRLAQALPVGTGLLDAPVLGSLAEAEAGALTILAGGPTAVLQASEPVLAALGKVIHVGELGAGAAAKLVANAALFAVVASLGEALALGRALGLSTATLFDVMACTPLGEQAAKRRRGIEERDFRPRFALRLAHKDAALVTEAGSSAGINLRIAEAVREWLRHADVAGLADRDYTAVIAAILGERADSGSSTARAPGGIDGLIVDLDGVVWLGGAAIDGAVEAITTLRERLGLLFLTNDPERSRSEQAARLTAIGIPAGPADVMTSAAATASYLRGQPELVGSPTLVVGSPALRQEIEQAGFQIIEREQASRAALVVVGGYERFEYRDLAAATTALARGAALYGTARDPVTPTRAGPQPATGAILAAIETASGVQAITIGKPEPYIFTEALAMLPTCSHVAVVGDSLAADVAGAKRAGLRAILVLTGNTSREAAARASVRPDLILPSLAALGRLLAHEDVNVQGA
jgi:3-hydroxyisobutyrate dehydrogenase/2-hydroxy-3-oxopropionate reductase